MNGVGKMPGGPFASLADVHQLEGFIFPIEALFDLLQRGFADAVFGLLDHCHKSRRMIFHGVTCKVREPPALYWIKMSWPGAEPTPATSGCCVSQSMVSFFAGSNPFTFWRRLNISPAFSCVWRTAFFSFLDAPPII